MLRKLMIGALASAAMIVSTSAFAQGTAAEAKAMLEKAVAAVKADKAKAIASFKAGTDGFKDRDLYPFCFNISDGITQAAPPSVLGKDVRTIKDAKGNALITNLTDSDGWYLLSYKWTGKAATFYVTITPPTGYGAPVTKAITLKSNGYVEVDYYVSP